MINKGIVFAPMLTSCIFFMTNVAAQLSEGVIFHSSGTTEKSFKANGKRWLQLVDDSTIEAGLYKLRSGEKDPQPVHNYDEIYYVQHGKAKLLAGDSSFDARAGSLFYVKAGVVHRFFDINKDISVLVLFSKAKPSEKDISAKAYLQEEIERAVSPDTVTWTVFHRCTTLAIGIYHLPKITGGDRTQVHKVDEINVVLKGKGKFSIDGKDVDVKKGDIIYVPKGYGHFFHDLKNDFEVMILFENKSKQAR